MPRASVGPYEIRGPLGQGGGGEVFRAWDPRLERDVALKILHARFENDPERVKSFVAEARAASALNHPNIVTVFDAAVDGGTSFIVSELIDGRPLRDELNRGPIPLKRLLDLATQIADGLAAAHDARILHGDLKPENIMVTRAGRAKIVDFGLTRATGFNAGAVAPASESLHTLTEHGLVAGTVPYLSPERARGVPADFRSDQFSFGLVLYEMVTGKRAFRRDTPAATLDAIVHEEVLPVQTTDARVPVQLRWIIERCLAKDPGERYSATADLHRDLHTLRARLAEALPAGAGEAGRRPRSWWLIAVAAAAVLAAMGAVAAMLLRPPATPDLSAARFMPFVTDPGYQGFPAVSPKGQTVAYSAEVNGVLQIFTRTIGQSESAQVTREPFDCKYPFWSPDGERLYYVSLHRRKDGIYAISATSGVPQLVVEDAMRGAISSDNQTIAFLRDEGGADVVGRIGLWVASPGGSAPWPSEKVKAAAARRGTFKAHDFIDGTLAFSPDRTKLGLCVVPNPRAESVWEFWIVPLPSGQEYRRLAGWTDPAPRLSSFTWLPDSRRVLLGATSLKTPGSHLWLADLDSDRVWPVTLGPDSQSYPSASSTGDQIVFTEGEVNYDLVEISLDKPDVRPFLQTTRNETDADVSRDGKQLIFVTDRAGQDEIWIRSRDGRVPDRVPVNQASFGDDYTMMLGAPSFSPNGDRFAYLRNGLKPRFLLRVWISPLQGALRTPAQPRAYEAMQGPPTWSPNGEIAYPEWKDDHWNLVRMRVDGDGKDEPVVIRTDGVANATPHWSPTGEWITWETERGFMLVSPDGKREVPLSDDTSMWSDSPWLVHAWSHDGQQIYGIKLSDDRRLKLVAQRWAKGETRELKDLGLSPVVNNPVRGFSVSADGRTFITSLAQMPGDLWLLTGLDWQPRAWWKR